MSLEYLVYRTMMLNPVQICIFRVLLSLVEGNYFFGFQLDLFKHCANFCSVILAYDLRENYMP